MDRLNLLPHHALLHSQAFLSTYQMVSRRLIRSSDMILHPSKILNPADSDSDLRSRDQGRAKRQVIYWRN